MRQPEKSLDKNFKFFECLTYKNEKWALSHLSDGKRVVPYEKLRSYKDLGARPEGEFFC